MSCAMEGVAASSSVPATAVPSNDFIAPLVDAAALRRFFKEHGYAVIRNAVPGELCQQTIAAFNRDVKPDKRFFKRHESSTYERHVFTDAGFMKYPIMNIQDLSDARLNEFRDAGLRVLTHRNIQNVMTSLFGEPGKIIHTMYFDGNQKTWAHRDSHYLDSEQTGRMIGVWVAAEDIHPEAGRFFVHAGSHRATLAVDDADPNGHDYKQKVAQLVEAHAEDWPRVAPVLRQGDVLIWSSLTVHGSLATTAPQYSRRSFTAHYIPMSHSYRWLRRYPGSHRSIAMNGVEIVQHQQQMALALQLEHRLRVDLPMLYRCYRPAYRCYSGVRHAISSRFPRLRAWYGATRNKLATS